MGLKHLRTRPYCPQTNGKAARFIRTMLNGWAYGATAALTDGSCTTTIADDTKP
jgi:transposase InsO family protein